jgi:hypothetical protein
MTADELRCPRCGSRFQADRRGPERRTAIRRENPSDDPRPPDTTTEGAATEIDGDTGDASETEGGTGDETERRGATRRTVQRRGGKPPLPGAAEDPGRWKD